MERAAGTEPQPNGTGTNSEPKPMRKRNQLEAETKRQPEPIEPLGDNGSGYFVSGDKRRPFEPGEALFVAAGVVHRFEDFSADFAAWVVFYGPDGGETALKAV